MLTRLSLVAVFTLLPALSFAQSAEPNGVPGAALCDGSEIRHAERVRTVGHSLFGATALADLVAVLTIPHNPGGAEKAPAHFHFIALTAPIALAGVVVADRASPGESFWQRVVARLEVGRTTSDDVRSCLQRPQVRTSNGREERWTYVMFRPSVLDAARLHSLRLTFRDSVLAEVLAKEVDRSANAGARFDSTGVRLDRRRGFCAPPIAVAADPFPTPTDTTAAAAAMARAQADAAAASKNAATFAAYAACMASDSVP